MFSQTNSRMLRLLQALGFVVMFMLIVDGVVREAAASSAECDRTVTRHWDAAAGDWRYNDSGCAVTDCDNGSNDPCYDQFHTGLGYQAHLCMCAETDAPLECVKIVYKIIGTYNWTGSQGPLCADYCSTGDCDPLWSSGQTQTLDCPCL